MDLELFEKVTKAVSYLYKEDATCPGVLVSTLRNGKFYISVQRFKKGAKDKTIVYKTSSGLLDEGLVDVAKWVVSQKVKVTNPVDDLKFLVDKSEEDSLANALVSSVFHGMKKDK